ncbi:ATP-binding protein [Nocardioides caldifontis]|uniref:ATP-binding protein n=1 Tax=Nocardioides caldifontis TaxID=2588938 RepID=UPI0011E01BD6|nr:ATP-binding protein [Nocardioides caldifontis]
MSNDLFRLSLHNHPDAVDRARHHVLLSCSGMPPDISAIAQLLTAELVNAAFDAGSADILLAVTTTEESLRVETTHTSAPTPSTSSAGGTGEPGRRLIVVEALARRWGVELHHADGARTVWFELRTRR